MAILHRHPDDSRLVAAMDRELPRPDLAAVRDHLEGCDPCRRRADELLTAARTTRAALPPAGATDAARHLAAREKLVRALDAQSQKYQRYSWHSLASRAPRAAAMAAVAVLATVAVWLPAYVSPLPAEPPRSTMLPIAQLTPGAVSSLTAVELCAGAHPSRIVAATDARLVLHSYDMENVDPTLYELDALITPELGGTATPANLWPQRYDGSVWNAHVKDEIEDHLRTLVCRGDLPLATAQREIAIDWVAAYRKYLRRGEPSPHTASAPDDAAPIVAVPAQAGQSKFLIALVAGPLGTGRGPQ